jgi:hypothetical protein
MWGSNILEQFLFGASAAELLHVVTHQVTSDAEEPGFNGKPAIIEVIGARKGDFEHLSGDVLGFIGATKPIADETEDGAVVAFKDLLPRFGVTSDGAESKGLRIETAVCRGLIDLHLCIAHNGFHFRNGVTCSKGDG